MPNSSPQPSGVWRLKPPSTMAREDRFLAFGGTRPDGFWLHTATVGTLAMARSGVEQLLDDIEKEADTAGNARNILASCSDPLNLPLSWVDLICIESHQWVAVRSLIDYVRRTRGLVRSDFADHGERFSCLVFGIKRPRRKRSQKAKSQAAEACA